MFDYLDYKNTFPVELFKYTDLPNNPYKANYRQYWNEDIRRNIEGIQVEYQGLWKWLPGPMFFYINRFHIELKDNTITSQTKVLGLPNLRDIEWIKGYVHAAARGFSGFRDDKEYSCHRLLALPKDKLEEVLPFTKKHIKDSITNPDTNELKTYVPVLEYLYRLNTSNLGRPYYYNTAKNVVDIETRNIGKSFLGSCFVYHNWEFDGATDYDEYELGKKNKKPLKSETLIAAIDAKYSKGTISKLLVAMANLPGSCVIGNDKFPPPLFKKYSGSLEPSKFIIAQHEVKEGGVWTKKGSSSLLHHRTFTDNPMAANGTRGGFNLIEEVGFMGNLIPSLGQLAECTTAGGDKFGTIWMTGTGGDMEGGSTEAVKEVFYDPSGYDCLEFDDLFEGSNRKIGFFVPAWMAFDKYRDSLGNVNKELAIKELMATRLELTKAKNKDPLNSELQSRPLVPSEAFLAKTGTLLPIADIKAQLNHVESLFDTNAYIQGLPIKLVMDPITGKPVSEVDPSITTSKVQIKYPTKLSKDNLDGSIIIWEDPVENPPYGLYVAGTDPYAHDDTSTEIVSVGSTYILKRAMPGYGNHDKIVAEYVGRPTTLKEHNERIRRLLIYYNALNLYENNFNNLKEYFETKNSLYLLANTPTILKNTPNKGQPTKVYGIRMHGDLKKEIEIYLRDWLLQEVDTDGTINLHHIYSIPLLKELLAYNEEGNFDRVIALMLTIVQKLEMHRIIVKKAEDRNKIDPFFLKSLFVNRSKNDNKSWF
jgi:hypothetical protein